MSLRTELLNEISSIEIIDTHEHLEREEHRANRKLDMFTVFMSHYVSSDLVSSGMSVPDMDKLKNPEIDLDIKWKIFQPYWKQVRNTGYCRAMSIAVRDLYGIEDINISTYAELDMRVKQNSKKGIYKDILKDRCNIKKSVLDVLEEPIGVPSDFTDKFYGLDRVDREYFAPAIRFDDFIYITNNRFIKKYQEHKRTSIEGLGDWLTQIRDALSDCKKKGITAIKSILSYLRILQYEEEDFFRAEKIFTEVLKSNGKEFGINEVKPLQDFLMHKVLEYASELGLPIQIHTGLQEGNGNYIVNSNPVHLSNLFQKYPKMKFDIFHGGYPYGSELAAMAKNFPNVFINMCWLHIISPEYSVRILGEWLDTVPSNKIFGFGGDYLYAEGVYGHLQIAKDNIVRVLEEKVLRKHFTTEQALEIAKRLLRDNAGEFYKMI